MQNYQYASISFPFSTSIQGERTCIEIRSCILEIIMPCFSTFSLESLNHWIANNMRCQRNLTNIKPYFSAIENPAEFCWYMPIGGSRSMRLKMLINWKIIAEIKNKGDAYGLFRQRWVCLSNDHPLMYLLYDMQSKCVFNPHQIWEETSDESLSSSWMNHQVSYSAWGHHNRFENSHK